MKARIKITGHKTDRPRTRFTGKPEPVVFKDPVRTFVDVNIKGISRDALILQLEEIIADLKQNAWPT